MILDSTTKRVRAYLAGAVTTNEPEYITGWVDHQVGSKTRTPGGAIGLMTSATPVEIIVAPTGSIQREPMQISIYNADTVAVTVTVDIYDGSNARRWIRAVLNPNWVLAWEYGGTWYVYDENGIIQGMAASVTAEITVEEEDGSPSLDSINKIQFDQADGFSVSQITDTTARVNISGVPSADEEARFLAFYKMVNRGL